MERWRRAERKVKDDWQEIKFETLKTGDVFRLFNPTGDPVRDREGKTIFKATSDAYPEPEPVGNFGIKVEAV